MPNRILKESICTDRALAALSAQAECLFHRLTVKVDDYGIFYADPQLLASLCFPFHSPSPDKVADWLSELEAMGLVRRATVEGEPFVCIERFMQEQRLRSKNPKYPAAQRIFFGQDSVLPSFVVDNKNASIHTNESTDHSDTFKKTGKTRKSEKACILKESKKHPELPNADSGVQVSAFADNGSLSLSNVASNGIGIGIDTHTATALPPEKHMTQKNAVTPSLNGTSAEAARTADVMVDTTAVVTAEVTAVRKTPPSGGDVCVKQEKSDGLPDSRDKPPKPMPKNRQPAKLQQAEKEQQVPNEQQVPMNQQAVLSLNQQTADEQAAHFNIFWQAYPKKVAEAAARQAFFRLAPDDVLFRAIMDGLQRQKTSSRWCADGGRYIPRAAAFLADSVWHDGTVDSVNSQRRLGNFDVDEFLSLALKKTRSMDADPIGGDEST